MTLHRWAGIDEAGYGPNLGPLVMVAVTAEGPAGREPDVWADLPATVARANGPADRLWVDDSKQVTKARRGRDHLDAGALATVAATGRPVPTTLGAWLAALGSGTLASAELVPWLDAGVDPRFPRLQARSLADRLVERRPLAGAPWRVVDVRAVVVGPRRFNAGLAATDSKARVHFAAFAELLAHIRATTPGGQAVAIRGDKHGGRHFYAEPLAEAFPHAQIRRGPEGPDLSEYEVIGPDPDPPMTVRLVPRADAGDGLVALASIVAKATREAWMDAFNAHWAARIPGLKPTAGYPVDAARFRSAIQEHTHADGLALDDWWRAR